MNDAPGYWMNETSGVLRPAVEGYLKGAPLSGPQIAALRAYFRQWINAGAWRSGEALEELRRGVDRLMTRAEIDSWLDDALDLGIDPL
jgi:hypothetical protein